MDSIDHIGQLTPDSKNARRHNPRNVGLIVDALHEVGAARSIVIDENGRILAGNATVEAAAEAGIEHVQVVDVDGETIVAVRRRGLTEAQKVRLALYDNRSAELADWDPEILADLQGDDGLLDDLFADFELEDLLGDLLLSEPVADPGAQIDKAAELQEKWQVETGDLWEIGAHRLVCGDCTDRAVVERVMDGGKALLLATDPPYNVGVAYGKKFDDSKGEAEYESFCRAWFSLWAEIVERQIVTPGCNNLARWLRYFEPYHVAPWTKTNSMTNGKIARWWCWEPILFFGEGWKRDRPNDVFDFPIGEQSGVGGHPCPKPLKMWVDLIQYYSNADDIVTDPFLGSGTTMVACEQLGRRCFGIEIEPKYCAVTLERLAGMGLEPRRME